MSTCHPLHSNGINKHNDMKLVSQTPYCCCYNMEKKNRESAEHRTYINLVYCASNLAIKRK